MLPKPDSYFTPESINHPNRPNKQSINDGDTFLDGSNRENNEKKLLHK